ncbi:hypothetical protein GCM10011591_39940 [Nocardia camponoti]|uniref:Uncharacterized protein n=2 Tax=Nocardia camponoti TaxID=1616106 RepID=A0A917QRJ3_9NOCA|nr:hypothetical protein GCM10011591_39940 [Nocardia camponoti]
MAPTFLDLAVLREALDEQNVGVRTSNELGAGLTLAETPLQKFDLGVVVVPTDDSDGTSESRAAILIEAGIAYARGLPLLFIVDPSDRASLQVLSGTKAWTVRARIDNREAIRLHLRLLIQSITRNPDSDFPPVIVHGPPGKGKSELIARLVKDSLEAGNTVIATSTRSRPPVEPNVAERLEQLLHDRGIAAQREVRTTRHGNSGRIDLIFSHPQIDTPVFVELLSGLQDKPKAHAEAQLAQYIRNESGTIGLVLYYNLPPSAPEMSAVDARVWSVSMVDFLHKIDTGELGSFLRRIRNETVHGR